jgi:hypothetical protein
MDALFEALCFSLDDEIERQENILAVCQAQGEAARTHDLEYLEAKTAALFTLAQEAAQAEGMRRRLLNQIAAQLGVSAEEQRLTELIQLASEPWVSRMRYFQSRLQTILKETRGVARCNAVVLRASLRVLSQAVGALEQCAGAYASSYTADGTEPLKETAAPTLLDRKG